MFDFNVRSRSDDLDLTHGTDGERRIPKQVAVLEIKSGKALPLWLIKILDKYKCRSQAISKYCLHYKPVESISEIIIDENKGDFNNVNSVYRKLTIV